MKYPRTINHAFARPGKQANKIVLTDTLSGQYVLTDTLLDLCGASIDARALPLLKRRLQEEEAQIPALEARGYIRMREKSEQLVESLKPLIEALEETSHDTQS